MEKLNHIHHVAIIASDYSKSKQFYTEILGLTLLSENYREEKKSWKADLALNWRYIIELFSFPNSPTRLTNPEANGLRHIAFAVKDIIKWRNQLINLGVRCEEIRVDEYTWKKFFFFCDPDQLPLELYENNIEENK